MISDHLALVDPYLADHGALQKRQALWRLVVLNMLLQVLEGLCLAGIREFSLMIIIPQLHTLKRKLSAPAFYKCARARVSEEHEDLDSGVVVLWAYADDC